jgi:hypothetical protein
MTTGHGGLIMRWSGRGGQSHGALLRGYWDSLRQGRALPRRDRIDPRCIAPALEHVFLIERLAPGSARFRIAGQEVCAMAGRDLRGLPFSLLLDPAARPRLAPQLDAVFTGPSVLDMTLRAMPERAVLRVLVLPLTGWRGGSDLAIGCVDAAGLAPAAVPRRFQIDRILREPLATDDTPPAPRSAARPGPRPHLTLVHSRD